MTVRLLLCPYPRPSLRLLLALTLAASISIAFGGDLAEDAQALAAGGQRVAAIKLLKERLANEPDHAEARFVLGELLLRQRDYRGAEKELSMAETLGVPYSRVAAPLAETLLGQDRTGEVLTDIDPDAGETPAQQARIRVARGRAQMLRDEVQAAEREYRLALTVEPSQPDALAELTRLALSQGDEATAVELSNKALAAHPDYPAALHARALVQRAQRRHADAIATLQQALKADPGYSVARVEMAENLASLGRFDEALGQIELIPDAHTLATALYTRAEILFRKRDRDGARDQLYQLLQLDPANLQGHLLMAYVAFDARETETTLYHVGEVLKAHPNHLGAVVLRANALLQAGQARVAREALGPYASQISSNPLLGYVAAQAAMATGDVQAARSLVGRLLQSPFGELMPGQEDALKLLEAGNIAGAMALIQRGLTERDALGRAQLLPAREALREGDWDAALAHAGEAQSMDPRGGKAWELAGLAHLGRGDIDAAAQSLRYALKLDPSLAGAAATLARIELAAGRAEAARDLLEQATAERPDFLPAYLMLANLEAQTDNPSAAAATLTRALDANPQEPALLAALGELQWRAGDHAVARETLDALVAQQPENAHAYYLLSMPVGGAGDWQEARRLLDKALELDPQHLPAGLAAARLSIQEQDYEDAARVLGALTKAHPDAAEVADVAVELALARERPDEALVPARQAQERAPSRLRALRLFEMLWHAQQPQKAAKVVRQWLVTHPDDHRARLILANAELRLGERAAARANLERVLEADPDSVPALNNLALLLLESDSTQAMDHAQRAARMAPEEPAVLDTLAQAHIALRQFDAAEHLLRQAIEKAPEQPALRLHLAQALKGQGNAAGARAELQRILAEEADFPERAKAEQLLLQLN
jgi:tetratricopeptide (TPR) repeat protein